MGEFDLPHYGVFARGLSKEYKKGKQHLMALDGVTLGVRPGEVYGLLGANGSGKSTLIKLICGQLNATSGNAWVMGRQVNVRDKTIKQLLGYMPQHFALYPNLSMSANIKFFAGLQGIKKSFVQRYIEQSEQEIDFNAHKPLSGMPLGMRQLLAFRIATLHQPRVLILDEPTAGMEPAAKKYLMKSIYEYACLQTSVIICTHHMDEAEHCDKLMILESGREKISGSTRRLKADFGVQSIADLYLNISRNKNYVGSGHNSSQN